MSHQDFTIRIFAHDLRVLFVDELNDGIYGEADLRRQVIRIRTGLSDSMSLETLMHEIAHCVLDLSGVSSCYGAGKDEVDEAVAQAVGTGLAQVLIDNPGIWGFFYR